MSRADRVYRMTHTKGSRFLRAPGGFETVEVVEIASGETLLFWDVPARDARRFVSRLRADLVTLDAETFLERWSADMSTDGL